MSFGYSAGSGLSKPLLPIGFIVRSTRSSRGAAVGLQSSLVAQLAMWLVGWEIPRGIEQSGYVNRTGDQKGLPWGNPLGIVDAEVDRLFSLIGGLSRVTTLPATLADSGPVT